MPSLALCPTDCGRALSYAKALLVQSDWLHNLNAGCAALAKVVTADLRRCSAGAEAGKTFEHRTMVQFMWQADLYGIAKLVTDCLGVYYDTDPRHLISPRWLEEM